MVHHHRSDLHCQYWRYKKMRSELQNQTVSCILEHETKKARRWLSCFVTARIVLNYGECFLNGIIALQRQASALAGYWWYSSEFQRATNQLPLTCFIRSGVIGDSRLEKYVSRCHQDWNLPINTDPKHLFTRGNGVLARYDIRSMAALTRPFKKINTQAWCLKVFSNWSLFKKMLNAAVKCTAAF